VTAHPLRRILADPGTPKARLAGAGVLGLAAAAATIGLLAGSGYVLGRAALRPGLGAIAGILAVVEVLAFLRGPLRYEERLVGHDAALRALARWRLWLYDCLTPRVPAALAGWRSGDLLARAVDDVDAMADLYLRTALPVAIGVAAAVLGTVAVGFIVPWAAAALGIPLAVALVVPAALVWYGNADGDLAALNGEVSARVVDALHGAAELLAFGADTTALDSLDALSRRADALERRHARVLAGAGVVMQVCLAAAVAGVTAIGVAAVHDHRVGQVMVAVLPLAALGTFDAVLVVPLAVARARDVRASAQRLLHLDEVPVPVVDPASPAPAPVGVPEVAFEEAALRYGDGLPRALDGVSLDLRPGERLSVTGSSGSGKSSLVNALLRYWPLEEGSLLLGGADAAHLAQADVRRASALADQHAHLFAGTLRSNLVLGRPDAGDEEVAAALEAAGLAGWVRTLPLGLDTPVGDEGVQLSGGERRRLAVARALLAPGAVLVLDEPTSGLDPQLADSMLDGVLAAAQASGRSVLLVTHRQSEAARCESTIALEAGRVMPAH
jgi:ATP-binding cassette subfamily C protein/ATP-binding cassette subfamily C protein CydC